MKDIIALALIDRNEYGYVNKTGASLHCQNHIQIIEFRY